MSSDRDQGGKFQPGNQAAKGSRHGKAHELRRWFRDAVTEDDVRAVSKALVAKAKEGDAKAAGILLDRLYGRPRTEPAAAIDVSLEDGIPGVYLAVEAALRDGELSPEEATEAVESLGRLIRRKASDQRHAELDALVSGT